AANHTLNAALTDASIDNTGVGITPVVEEGAPARVLIDAAADAELLVVGSRGRGSFAGLLLGSVSQRCAQGATCPVVIVPPPHPGEAAGGIDR
ncbi:universal stress protein, partial [Mycobacteroides chelonae]|uniref:universal stress protein n=1 Tax=Mycobacteroides chelonae TaxID=1774 RepID=UPI000A6B1E92